MDEKILEPVEEKGVNESKLKKLSKTSKRISELANEKGLEDWKLLELFHDAGMQHDDGNSIVSFKDWKKVLYYKEELEEEQKYKENMREEIKPIDNIILRIIIEVVRAFVIIIWSFVGLFFWIPLLGRVTTAFSAAIFSSVLKGGSTHNAQMQLDKASKFYINGFIKINQSISSIITGKFIDGDRAIKPITISKGAILFEVFFSLVFWFIGVSAVLSLFGESEIVMEWVFDKTNGFVNLLGLPNKGKIEG